MSIGISILIFFVSLIALVAEFILYMILGISSSYAAGVDSWSGLAFFFVGLMILTAATGLLAPLGAIIGVIFKKKSIANKFLAVCLLLIGVGYFIGIPITNRSISTILTDQNTAISGPQTSIIKRSQRSKNFEIVNIDTRVTESNDVWWKYAWKLTIRNLSDRDISVNATIEWLDEDGFIVDDDTAYRLYIPANEEKTFHDYALITASVAKNVKSVNAKVK